MPSKRFLIILIILLALALLSVSVFVLVNYWPQISGSSDSDNVKDHGYYKELTEFKFNIKNFPDGTTAWIDYPSPILAKYIKQESFGPEYGITYTTYIFQQTIDNTQIGLFIPLGAADNINMIPGEQYKIDYQIHPGWPSTYRLIIYTDDTVIFIGISDWSVNNNYYLTETMPIIIEQTKILTNHYHEGGKGDFWIRKTNTEIKFTLDTDSINLHQGQSMALGDYDITLHIAREIEYKPNWYDVGQNGISYVIVKRGR